MSPTLEFVTCLCLVDYVKRLSARYICFLPLLSSFHLFLALMKIGKTGGE